MSQPRRRKEPPDHALVQAQAASGGGGGTPDTVTLVGLYEKVSTTRRRVYLTRDLASYAEFNASDFVDYEDVPAQSSPIPGVDATRVTLKRGAPIDFVYSHRTSVAAHNQTDIDVRCGLAPGGPPVYGPDRTMITTTKVCHDYMVNSTQPCLDSTMYTSLTCWFPTTLRTI